MLIALASASRADNAVQSRRLNRAIRRGAKRLGERQGSPASVRCTRWLYESEGVFTSSGHFVHIPCIWLHRATEIWQDKVFDLLLDAFKIDHDVVASMRGWKHSGFSVDFSVCIEAGDHAGMQRLVEYIARCPFSLGRMIMLSSDGKVLYRAANPGCIPFPVTGDKNLIAGIPRNFEVFDPLDFLAEVTQHIPNKGEHQIRYYGFYSNKSRGIREQDKKPILVPGQPEPDTAFRRKCRMTWAAFIKCVYEVDPLKCPKCGGEMKIVSFIEEKAVIEKILRHCSLPACRSLGAGRWREHTPRPPPPLEKPPPIPIGCAILDYGFFEKNCA